MGEVATIGLDLAKQVFQVYGSDAEGNSLFNRKLRRSELLDFFRELRPCLVGMEACATAHYWAQHIALLGHEVRLIPPQYVKPFVKRGKTDANDAEAINEALSRKTMRFTPVKTPDQQAASMVFRTRALLVRQRTQAINALRSHLAEIGLIAPRGQASFKTLAHLVRDGDGAGLPATARNALQEIVAQVDFLNERIGRLEREIVARAKIDTDAKRLMTIPGVGPLVATAMTSLVPDIRGFKSARHFAAWIGVTPISHSSGETVIVGSISKMGNSQLRKLLFLAASSVLRFFDSDRQADSWLGRLRRRRPYKVVVIALANKIARIIWALLVRGGIYAQSGDVRPELLSRH